LLSLNYQAAGRREGGKEEGRRERLVLFERYESRTVVI